MLMRGGLGPCAAVTAAASTVGLPEYVDVMDGKLRVGPDGISVINPGSPGSRDLLPPIVRLEDLVFERHLDRTEERNVSLYRRAGTDSANNERKERYAVKELNIKNQRDTLHVVAAEVGAAFSNRSEFTVGLRNAYLRNSTLSLVMEYMDGRSLADLLKNHVDLGESMPEEVAAYVTHRLLLALQCLHGTGASTPAPFSTGSSPAASPGLPGSKPSLHIRSSSSGSPSTSPLLFHGAKRVVHRDVKPSNVLLNSSGAVKLADFGVAGSTDSIGLATFVGTVTYMSPERIHGKGYNTPSDVWSVGAVAAEMLLGHHPFLGDSAKSKHMQQMQQNRAASHHHHHQLHKTLSAAATAAAAAAAPSPPVGVATLPAAVSPAPSSAAPTASVEKPTSAPVAEGRKSSSPQQHASLPSSPPPVPMTADAPGTKAASAAAAAHQEQQQQPGTSSGGGGNKSAGVRSGLGSGSGGMGQFYELFERVTRCDDFDVGANFSDAARDFVKICMWQDPDKRPSATELLQHPWVARFNNSNNNNNSQQQQQQPKSTTSIINDDGLALRKSSSFGTSMSSEMGSSCPAVSGTSPNGSASVHSDLLRLRSDGSFVVVSPAAVPTGTAATVASSFVPALVPESPASADSAPAVAVIDEPKKSGSSGGGGGENKHALDAEEALDGEIQPQQPPQPSQQQDAKPAMTPQAFACYVLDIRRRAKEREAAERATKRAHRAEKGAAAGSSAAASGTASPSASGHRSKQA